ncbi:MAG TPA: hypothetical protein VH740_05645 [Vicinamibacterales bacterium]|jgi:hypothetical protein
MHVTTGSAAVLAFAALVSMKPSGPQVQPMPGPGSGVVTVTGKVEIANANALDVSASQRGDWKVAVTALPTVVLAPLPFVKAGARYEVVWQGGEKEQLRVVQPAAGEWAQVESTGGKRARWINLATARSVEELQ